MKCPKCGHEIKEGHLYCDVCGEEIRIVPDFDATSDENLKISLTGVIDTESVLEGLNKTATKEIVKEVEKEATKEIAVKRDQVSTVNVNKSDNKLNDKKQKKPFNKSLVIALVIAGAVCVVLLIGAIVTNMFVGDYYSADTQYEKAFDEYQNGQYEDSIKTLKHCLSIEDSEDPDVSKYKLLIADNYYQLGKIDESNAVLYELKNEFPSDINIYEKLIRNYEKIGDYTSISKLIDESNNELIKETFSDYTVSPVTFSYEDGSYDEILYVELKSDPDCVIYYTIDGSDVNTASSEYSEPIVLDSGDYTINAFAVNSKGIQSGISTATYTVDFYVPDAPVIVTGGGTYNTPKPIVVESADYDLCYYTVNGEDPTPEDEIYKGPLPMYIGKHTYKFATISNKGVSSEVVSVDITLDLITLIDMDTAKNNLKTWMSVSGKNSGNFEYKCEQACVFNNQCYYIINEYMSSESDEKEKQTGNHYAVDVLTGLTYRAILNSSTGEYTLEVLI